MSKSAAQATQATVQGGTRSNASVLQRQSTLGPHVCVQREAAADQDAQPRASSLVREVIDSPGRPLDAATRSRMEPRFGFDFSHVRIHSDNRASESARAVNANAYTAGNHVAFGAGKYAPGTSGGQQLLAHELTHVVQQASGPVAGTEIAGGLRLSHPSDPFERKAAAAGASADRNHDHAGNRRDALPIRKEIGATSVQRDDSLGLSTGSTDQAPGVPKGVNQAAALSSWSALGSAIGGLGSAVAAFWGLSYAKRQAVAGERQAAAGERQADASEDPPVAQPVEGGAKSNNPVDVVPVKPPDEASEETESVKTKDTTKEARAAKTIGPNETQTVETTTLPDGKTQVVTTTKDKKGNVISKEKKTTKPAAKGGGETQKSINLLQVKEGKKNIGRYILNLVTDGKEIKGGSTRDGVIDGYTGGSVASSVNVNFKTKEAQPVPGPDKNPIAAVLVQFGGYNTPPRMDLVQDKKPVKRDNNPQRFSGTVKFDATGSVVDPVVTSVSPRGTGGAPDKYGKGTSPDDPVVFIALNTNDALPTPKKKDEKEEDPF